MTFFTQGSIDETINDCSVIYREHEIDAIMSALLNSHKPAVTIIAPRQMGKTTLLRQLQRTVNDPKGRFRGKKRVAYVSLERYASLTLEELKDTFYDELGKQIKKNLGVDEEWMHEKHDIFHNIPPNTFVLFDEFSSVACQYPNFLHRLRDTLETGFTGSGVVLADRIDPLTFTDLTCSPYNISTMYYLQELDRGQVYRLICAGVEQDVSLQVDVTDVIYNATQGHPYLVQKLGQLMERERKKEQRSALTIDDANAAINTLLALGYAGHDTNLITVTNNWKQLNEKEKATLNKILKGRSVPFSTNDPYSAVPRLFTLGFITARYVEEYKGIPEMTGHCIIRNPIYNKHLQKINKE